MPWSDRIQPVRMTRVALVAPDDEALRAALAVVADTGTVEFDVTGAEAQPAAGDSEWQPRLSTDPPQSAVLDDPERRASSPSDLLAGEAQLRHHADAAIRRHGVAGLVGWCPSDRAAELNTRLAPAGASLVPLPAPRGVDPPTLLHPSPTMGRSFSPLIQAYGTVPYADVDPTWLAGVAYIVMFGMMFADAGHGLLLVAAALALRWARPRRLANVRRLWPFVAGAGLASTGFGLLFGEFFGPTGLVPVLWLSPLEQPVQLLAAGVAVGAVLLAFAYAVGVVNRWREGAARRALYAPSGIAGAALFAGLGTVAAGVYLDSGALTWAGLAIALPGLVLVGVGQFVTSGGGAAGGVQTTVELVDLVIRLGANLVSFARLAAFGLTHAAIAALVWSATSGLWGRGGWSLPVAVLVFVAGTALAFALEALIAGVQALRLEYYELFSRVFDFEGRPFRPWHVPVVRTEASR